MDKQTIVHIATWATFVVAASFCTHKIGTSSASLGRRTALFFGTGVLLMVLFGLGRGLAYFVLCPILLLVYSRRNIDAQRSTAINGKTLGLLAATVANPALGGDLYLFNLGESKSTSISRLRSEGVPFAEDTDESVIFKLVNGEEVTFGQLTYGPSAKLVRISFGHPKERQFIVSYKQFVTFSDKLIEKLGSPSLDSLANRLTAEIYRQSTTDLITVQEAVAAMKDSEATWERVWNTERGIYILKLAKHDGVHNALILLEDIGFFNSNRGMGPSSNKGTAEQIFK